MLFQEPLIRPLAELERIAILDALMKCHGDKRLAAERLGITERTIYRKLHEYGVPLRYAGRDNSSVDGDRTTRLTESAM